MADRASGMDGRAAFGFEANAPRSGPRTAGFGGEVGPGDQRAKTLGARTGRYRSYGAMKLFTGWVMLAGLVFSAAAANAQVPAPYRVGGPHYAVVSDVGGPYAAVPEYAPVPRYGPRLLPPEEVYTVLR